MLCRTSCSPCQNCHTFLVYGLKQVFEDLDMRLVSFLFRLAQGSQEVFHVACPDINSAASQARSLCLRLGFGCMAGSHCWLSASVACWRALSRSGRSRPLPRLPPQPSPPTLRSPPQAHRPTSAPPPPLRQIRQACSNSRPYTHSPSRLTFLTSTIAWWKDPGTVADNALCSPQGVSHFSRPGLPARAVRHGRQHAGM